MELGERGKGKMIESVISHTIICEGRGYKECTENC
jgi:hypothetical protein